MMCLNKKVLIGAGVVAGGLFLVKPAWAVAALPLLILALCPLSMIFMMRGMGSQSGKGGKGAACGTSGATAKSTTATTATGTDLDKQIADLQEEVRILRAANTQQQASAPRVDFSKPDEPGPRP
ncbi:MULTISPECIES: DUF2933 domain-containing protein [Streptomyces]|uniref:DUF2933 domain-containing protein n=1 Tax=Streptomyces zinciresistens K42 TaxID=700597 RepID=G2G5U2_9ACTN|nr:MULTISPECIES: DUF2933 domain-containing protein [Streptomyces]EGX61031.1 hypothetical protein SZN_04231 [Streptomyces zinciresistens K42]MDT9696557.1 DUF2933 domain-containing protein [Streptomyces sp. P17]